MTDTGPPYPRYAPGFTPGSNGIGQFQIGVSPIGDLSPWDVWATVISQYANSTRLTGLIESFSAAIDQTENMDDFYDLVWNVLTAQGYGLDVWGRIVGISRTLHFPSGGTYLGFEEASSWTGFGQGGFYTGTSTTNNFILSDADYRRLILAKAAANITDGSIQSLNAILLALFPARGAAYVADNMDMTVTLTFAFVLNAIDLAIVQNSGVLPIPAGVAITISQL